MSDEMNRRDGLVAALGLGAFGAAVLGVSRLSDQDGQLMQERIRREKAFGRKLRALPCASLTVEEDMGAIGATMVMVPAPIIVPAPDSVKQKVTYVMPREFIELHKAGKLTDPHAVARVFGIALTGNAASEGRSHIGCYTRNGELHVITRASLRDDARVLSDIIRSCSDQKLLPAHDPMKIHAVPTR